MAAGILLMTTEPTPQFLLMKHTDRWDLPKGHCEPGETLRSTALRETEEETGIPSSAIQLDEAFEFTLRYPVTYRRHGEQTFQKEVHYFLGRIAQKVDVTLTEHPDYAWLPWSPPHHIQTQTIDPLLKAISQHLDSPE
ncbi:MAG: NUDIX domain-containing protein [Planctomycetota bacterium]